MDPSLSASKRIVVVVPALNEEERIGETVRELRRVGQEMAQGGHLLSVYVIDDGSTDATGRLAREAGADRILRHRVNQGLGAAVRTGLAAARGDGADLVVKFDADLQHDPGDIPALLQPILAGDADVVYGNRLEKIEYRMPLIRRVGNIVITALMRRLTGWPLEDGQPGILAVNRSYLEVFYLPGDYNYTQQILLDAFHKGMRFAHVPVSFRRRVTGRSFVSLKYPFKVLPQILMVLVAVKPMRVFVPLGLLFLAAAGGVFGVELVLWFLGRTFKPVLHVNAVLGLSFFGLQTVFFGILAELIVQVRRR